MKFFYIFLILVLNISLVNAEISIFKEVYSPKEVFQAEFNFQNLAEEITPSNVKILNSELQPSNIGFLLTKITDEKYFIHFDIPDIEGEYFLAINIKYLDKDILRQDTLDKKFTIRKDENDIISISPSFLTFKTNDKNFFKVDIKNKGLNIVNVKVSEDLNLTSIFNNNLTIAKNSEDSFFFNIIESQVKDRDKLNINLNYGSKQFILPVYLLTNKEKGKLSFYKGEKEYINEHSLEIPFGNYAESSIFIENNLDKNLSGLSLSLSQELAQVVKIGFDSIESLEQKDKIQLTLFINLNRNIKIGQYKGILKVSNKETESSLLITINIVENQLYNETKDEQEIITAEETVNIEKETAKSIEQKKKLDKKKIVYTSIFLVILFFIFLFIIIYIKTGKKKKRY
ncbi:MAG: hypothetical protein AABW58_00135 [Nanoarchaeota archaeon]